MARVVSDADIFSVLLPRNGGTAVLARRHTIGSENSSEVRQPEVRGCNVDCALGRAWAIGTLSVLYVPMSCRGEKPE